MAPSQNATPTTTAVAIRIAAMVRSLRVILAEGFCTAGPMLLTGGRASRPPAPRPMFASPVPRVPLLDL